MTKIKIKIFSKKCWRTKSNMLLFNSCHSDNELLTFENWTKKTNQMCRGFIIWTELSISFIEIKNKSATKQNELSKAYEIIFMRVWSWLRTNAGGVPNTCKSSEETTGACTSCLLSGERVSNTWVTYPTEGDNIRKRMLIPHRFSNRMIRKGKKAQAFAVGWTRGALASW